MILKLNSLSEYPKCLKEHTEEGDKLFEEWAHLFRLIAPRIVLPNLNFRLLQVDTAWNPSRQCSY